MRLTLTKNQYPDHNIGEYTYGKIKVIGKGKLTIGKFCSIAGKTVFILGADHRYDLSTTYPFDCILPKYEGEIFNPVSKGPIVVGNDVWIGQGAVILSGVTIGNGAVIGACSVVTRDVAPYSIAGGNPARHRKFRFDEATCAMLERVAWWNWTIEEVTARVDILMSPPDERWEQFIKK